MPIVLVLLFVVVPLVELVVILQVGQAIGAGWTVALLIAASVFGAWLLRVEGRRAWRQFRTALAEGRWPGDEVAQGALVIVGGTLLLTPGFVTDVLGFLLLVGTTRRVVAAALRRRLAVAPAAPQDGSGSRSGGAENGLDVEVVDIERETPPPPPDLPEGDPR